MIKGPASRKRASQRHYVKHLANIAKDVCNFCLLTPKSKQTLVSSQHFNIVKNIFGYDIWDGCRVIDHLMIVPKRHIHSLSELTKNEKMQYVTLLCEYERDGYSVYSRSPDNITKSIAHQHTHLIKLDKKRVEAILYLRKPHVMLFK